MVLSRAEILTIDATVIIGLLILLTFQSISSSFIENEASEFMKEWYGIGNELATIDAFLTDCNLLNEDRAAYEQLFIEQHIFISPDGSEKNFFTHLPTDVENEIKKKCTDLILEGLEKQKLLVELDRWGFNFNYLQQYDVTTELVYTYRDGYDYDPNLLTEESEYLHNLASGPLWVNLTNLAMIFPFIASAVIASINIVRDKETTTASRASVISMAVGFGMMFIGLIIIVYGFMTVYAPFTD